MPDPATDSGVITQHQLEAVLELFLQTNGIGCGQEGGGGREGGWGGGGGGLGGGGGGGGGWEGGGGKGCTRARKPAQKYTQQSASENVHTCMLTYVQAHIRVFTFEM